MEDHELKDLILLRLYNLQENSFCNEESISSNLNISEERASKLLEEIFTDSRCSRNEEKSMGKTMRKYVSNKDTAIFLKRGGYTKEYKKLRHENWPKRNWPWVALIGFVSGILATIIVQWSIRKIWPEPQKSIPSIQVSSDSAYKKV